MCEYMISFINLWLNLARTMLAYFCVFACLWWSHSWRKREFPSQSCWTQGHQKGCGHSEISGQLPEKTSDWCSEAVRPFQSDLGWGPEPQSQGLFSCEHNVFLFWLLDRKSTFNHNKNIMIILTFRNSWTAVHPWSTSNLKSSTTAQLNKKLMISNPSLFWGLLNCQQVR